MNAAEGATVVVPPAPEWAARLLGLYKLWDEAHARGRWARDLERRLSTPAERSHARDRFYVFPHGIQVAAALDVSRSADFAGLGIVHRVFTHPTMRRRGLARGLIEAANADFKAFGGRLLVVVAPGTGAAREFYASAGFAEVVRAADGEALLGWAARGRHVREAALRFLRHEPVRWRRPTPGDWAALVAWSVLPGGNPGASPATIPDGEWIDVFEHLDHARSGVERAARVEPPARACFRAHADRRSGGMGTVDAGGDAWSMEVGESRHGYVVAARATDGAPEWLGELARDR